MLAVGVSWLTMRFVDNDVVAYSTTRVKLDINSAGLIYNSKLDMIGQETAFVAQQVESFSPAWLNAERPTPTA